MWTQHVSCDSTVCLCSGIFHHLAVQCFLQAIQLCERSVNHHNLVIPLLSSAISHFKKYHCPRMKERLMVQMAEEYALSGDHDKAVM